MVAPRAGAWIETHMVAAIANELMSPPARGAWIETLRFPGGGDFGASPPRGGVD